MENSYTIKTIADWKAWEKAIGSLERGKWLFRGQSNSAWDLKTSIYRHFEEVNNIAKVKILNLDQREKLLINSFKKCAHLFIKQQLPDQKDDIEWLAIMQHHNAPTRLLDITESPYIALYFALCDGNTDAAVYAFNLKAMSEIDKKDKVQATLDNVLLQNKKNHYFILSYKPKKATERSLLQQGAFLIPNTNESSFEDILSLYANPNNPICIKMIIKRNMKRFALPKLVDMNITSKTLFPGLDGFCRSLRLDYMMPLYKTHNI